jgi:DHA1 family chloramphenicol resistance protein-like MFS transporter
VLAFNTGIVAAPWLGGRVINAGWGYLSVIWVGIGLAAGAVAATGWAARLGRDDTARTAAATPAGR